MAGMGNKAAAIAITITAIILAAQALPQGPESDSESSTPSIQAISNHYIATPIFQNKIEFDVVTVLLLLGEATIWKSIWSRFRFRRCHWKQWIFPISPGWAPLAGSLFAVMQSSRGPPNLIYDRAPSEAVYDNLQLTNLNSGASHRATNVILQNVFQAWYQGPRKAKRRPLTGSKFYIGKEVGIVDVDISRIEDAMNWTLYLQAACLLVQLTLSLVLGCLGWSLEVFITYAVTLAAQGLLLTAITPRVDAWDFRDLTRRKVAPVMLHMGMDTTSALFVRCATKDGQTFSLEEYSWESQTVRDPYDTVQLILAGLSFCIFAFQLILISWMSTESRLLFLILGFAGLMTNALEGAVEPPWNKIFKFSFSGAGFCEPEGGSLVSALGVLIGGSFAAGDSAAKLLYPDNKRLRRRLSDLRQIIAPLVCQNCSTRIRMRTDDQCLRIDGQLCCTRLRLKNNDSEINAMQDAKQVRDALATLSHFLRTGTEEEELPRIETRGERPSYDTYDWQKEK